MESDLGTFAPLGLQFSGSTQARAIMQEVVKLLAPINTTALEEHGEGTDIEMWMEAGVPGESLAWAGLFGLFELFEASAEKGRGDCSC